MDEALPWRPDALRRQRADADISGPATGATVGFSGDGKDRPVMIAVIHGPVAAAMAQDALVEAGIPAYVKQHSLGPVYGLTIGAFGTAEVWVAPTVVAQAREILIGLGLLEPEEEV